jgi:hypothetical protein
VEAGGDGDIEAELIYEGKKDGLGAHIKAPA